MLVPRVPQCHIYVIRSAQNFLTGIARKIFVQILETVDESNSARVLPGLGRLYL